MLTVARVGKGGGGVEFGVQVHGDFCHHVNQFLPQLPLHNAPIHPISHFSLQTFFVPSKQQCHPSLTLHGHPSILFHPPL